MILKKVKPLTKEYLESIGFVWHTDRDGTSYIADEVIVISQQEAQDYADAANELYDMFVKAGEYVIQKRLYHELGIPFNLVDMIEESWHEDVHWHIYGRFDFAGGIDGKPIKLLEFNADTPTALFETAILQWALLKYNGFNEAEQFNFVYEAIRDNFKRLVTQDIAAFNEKYEGWKILFSSIAGSSEDEATTKLLQTIATEAGFETKFCYADEVGFGEDGIFCGEERFHFWFKLIPWESIAIEEPELALLLTEIVKNRSAIILNPAYTLLFQSKRMLKILWDLFPNHPLLLESSFEPLKGKPYVQKPSFGREGENVAIFDEKGKIVAQRDGEYENFAPLYQEYVELPQDTQGRTYQAGVFYSYEACGLGFRRGGKIIDNLSKFVAHMVSDEQVLDRD